MIDKVVRTVVSPLSMRARIDVVKRYHLARRGRYLTYREKLLENEFEGMRDNSLLNDSWGVDTSGQLPFLWGAIEGAKEVLKVSDSVNARKGYLQNFLSIDNLKRYPVFLEFASSAEIVSVVASYLNFFPVLSSIEIWRSEAATDEVAKGSQKFHLDNVDINQVKVFVNIDSVDDSNGPLHFYGAEDSKRISEATKYGSVKGVHRLEDEEVYTAVNGKNALTNIGPSGTVAFVDTCNCFHFGSRTRARPRTVLMLQYASPCRADFRPRPLDPLGVNFSDRLKNLLMNPKCLA
ncbi:MAG: hypothetical protein K6L80_04700 [Agarilytica sp.]